MGENGRPAGQIPVHIITGFLGSGKTTLLRHLLDDPGFENTAVLINEFGEIGLDHLIAREVSEDVLLLDSGCLCCSAGDDLASTLLDLLDMRRDGKAEFGRVVIETSGLADPGPVVELVMADAAIGKHFSIGQVIATVDGINGGETLTRYAEAQHQIGLADAVIITKEDLIPSDHRDALKSAVRAMNAMAAFIDRAQLRSFLTEATPTRSTPRHLVELHHELHGGHGHNHTAGVSSFVVAIAEDIDLERFIRWLELLLLARGKSILRVKGLVAVAGEDRPRVLQAVQTIVYPLTTLERWPDSDHRTQLVFIGKNITASAIEKSLEEHAIARGFPTVQVPSSIRSTS